MPGEGASKMALTGKTSHERDLAHGEISLFEEMLRGLNATVHDILMGAFTSCLSKETHEVKGAEAALLGKLG